MGDVFVIKLSALGDLVQADGALRDIREYHGGDRVTVMTCPAYRRYMERCPWVDRVFIDPRVSRFNLAGMRDLRRRLQATQMDCVYDLQQVGRTRFYRRWLFPRVTWLGDARGSNHYLKRLVGSCAADHFARHLPLAGIQIRHTLNADLSWLADDVTGLLQQAGLRPGYVLLIPGASATHDQKRWPYFPELAARLLASGKRVITVPGPAEMALCRSIPGEMLVPPDGYHDVFVLAGLIKQAAFVIGNDTGPTHLAAHLRGRGLALFGPHTSATSTGIQYSRFDWLETKNLSKLPVETVWQQVVEQLFSNEVARQPVSGLSRSDS